MKFFKKKACKTDEDLDDAIMNLNNQQKRDSMGKILLKIKANIISLIRAAKHCSNKRKFWKKILKENPSETNLNYIIREISSLKIKAQKKFLKMYPEKIKKKY